MHSFASQTTKWALFLSILFTGAPVFALNETRMAKDDSYERLQHEFVLSSKNEVVAYCEAGDTLIKGSCEGRTQNFSNSQKDVLDNRVLETREVNELGRAGFACRAKIVRVDQELRLTAALKCRKGTDNKALKIKTPRNRGV